MDSCRGLISKVFNTHLVHSFISVDGPMLTNSQRSCVFDDEELHQILHRSLTKPEGSDMTKVAQGSLIHTTAMNIVISERITAFLFRISRRLEKHPFRE